VEERKGEPPVDSKLWAESGANSGTGRLHINIAIQVTHHPRGMYYSENGG